MHAAVARGPQLPFDLVDVELDEPRPNEVLVKLTASGICHTDLIIRDGWFPTPMPAVLGHEGAGVVERVGGDVTDISVGDRVVLTYSSCHQCSNCLGGAPAYCADFWAHNFAAARPDGSHAIREDDVEIGSSFFGQSSFAQYAVVDHRGRPSSDGSRTCSRAGRDWPDPGCGRGCRTDGPQADEGRR